MHETIYGVLALIAGMIAGKYWIPFMKSRKLRQTVRDDGPQTHLKKSGTPTLGGFIFLLPTLLTALFVAVVSGSVRHLPLLVFAGGAAFVGYKDDKIKTEGNPEGLSVRVKSLGLGVLILLFTAYVLYLRPEPPALGLPFIGWFEIPTALRPLYGAFACFFLYACINAVNITDGVDGLCASVTMVVLAALIVGLFVFRAPVMASTQVVPVRGLLAGLLGGLAAFLYYNRHPARIFMGDFGSLALGAAVSGTLLLAGLPFAFLSLGVIYWVEIGSVLVQRLYFRHTNGKRIFRMSPIHHHFEMGGWSEFKVVLVFSLFTLAGAGLTVLLFAPLLSA